MNPKLNYVFRVSVLSSKDDGSWVERTTVRQSNECKSTPAQLCGNIASHYLTVTERGVKVEFLGLQEDKKWNDPITCIGVLTLTLTRTV